jgi:PncC family amidohydrolase
MSSRPDPNHQARALAEVLKERDVRIVLAESCTAGLAAASLAGIAGISQYFCGSAVTYRNATKTAWLGVSATEIEKHTAVSAAVSRSMATGILQRTAEAEFGAAITGDLGPDAPHETDGVIFIAIARRHGDTIDVIAAERIELQATGRCERQTEAAAMLLDMLRLAIQGNV